MSVKTHTQWGKQRGHDMQRASKRVCVRAVKSLILLTVLFFVPLFLSFFPFFSFFLFLFPFFLLGIIMGTPIPVGTGLFQLLHAVDKVEKSKLVDSFSKAHLLMHTPQQKLRI